MAAATQYYCHFNEFLPFPHLSDLVKNSFSTSVKNPPQFELRFHLVHRGDLPRCSSPIMVHKNISSTTLQPNFRCAYPKANSWTEFTKALGCLLDHIFLWKAVYFFGNNCLYFVYDRYSCDSVIIFIPEIFYTEESRHCALDVRF